MQKLGAGLLYLVLLGGCTTAARLAAPPQVIGSAEPDGLPTTVRLVTTDLRGFAQRAPAFFQGIRRAAGDGPVNILALSGGGSDGAFGAGALVGLTRAGTRPQFQLVTGVSAGALIAPFAFLGSGWDDQLQQAFTGDHSQLLDSTPGWRLLTRLLFPLGVGKHNPLFDMVDRYVTHKLVAAVARESASGRKLIVATTDLDTRETVLWDMGVIASRGDESARSLFRDVLVASASVPGIFPPVLIHVNDGERRYEEMHVDGGVTTSVFTLPLVAGIRPVNLPELHGAHLYMIVNGQLARRAETTPVNTMELLTRSFSAEMTYKMREAIAENIGFARQLGMVFRITEVPVDYPLASFSDFDAKPMRALFAYAASCAERGQLWITPQESIRRNMHPEPLDGVSERQCPGALPNGPERAQQRSLRNARTPISNSKQPDDPADLNYHLASYR